MTEQGNLCEGGTDDLHASPAALVLLAFSSISEGGYVLPKTVTGSHGRAMDTIAQRIQ